MCMLRPLFVLSHNNLGGYMRIKWGLGGWRVAWWWSDTLQGILLLAFFVSFACVEA